jgi:multicomponent K+:H+ antiporter subunit D
MERPRESSQGGERAALCAVAALVAAPAVLALLAGPATSAMDATARQLFTPSLYVEAVLGTDGVAAVGGQP